MEYDCQKPHFVPEVTQMVRERNCLDLVLKRAGPVGIFSLATRGARPIIASANLQGITDINELAGELKEIVNEDYPETHGITIRIFTLNEETRNQFTHLVTITPGM